jgi:hypothetical protein
MVAKRVVNINGGVKEIYPSGIQQEIYDPPRKDGVSRVLVMLNGDRVTTYTDGRTLVFKDEG